MSAVIRPLDLERLREEYRASKPFPFVAIDEFLDPDFGREVAASYPDFERAQAQGFGFNFVNEKKKVQISDPAHFPAPVRTLHAAISSPEFLQQITAITGIEALLADEELAGAGMHVTGPQGRLDVHVDFNLIEARKLHRRLNILIYLNPQWHESWGGRVELWDERVKQRHHAFLPTLGRCVLFETSERSFHGVTAVTCPEHVVRRSFAAYYYTKQPPPHWDGRSHSTIFRARPDELVRGYVLMPVERAGRAFRSRVGGVKRRIKRFVGR